MLEKKYFLRGLSINTTNNDLFNYFKIYKKLIDYIVIKDEMKISKRIGFITFETENLKLLNKILWEKSHKIKGKVISIVQAKDFIQKKELKFDKKIINEKLFIGGLPPSKNLKQNLINYFQKYGVIESISLKIQKNPLNDHIKRYAFLIFKNKESSIRVLNDYKTHKINQKWIEVKPYQSREKTQCNLNKQISMHIRKYERPKSYTKMKYNNLNLNILASSIRTIKTKSIALNNTLIIKNCIKKQIIANLFKI